MKECVTYAVPSCRWRDSGSWDTDREASRFCSAAFGCSSPKEKHKSYGSFTALSRPLSVNHQDVKDSHLLSVQGVSGQFGQVKELQVQRAKLGQDAASGRCPAPTPAGATATESRAAAWTPTLYRADQHTPAKSLRCIPHNTHP